MFPDAKYALINSHIPKRLSFSLIPKTEVAGTLPFQQTGKKIHNKFTNCYYFYNKS